MIFVDSSYLDRRSHFPATPGTPTLLRLASTAGDYTRSDVEPRRGRDVDVSCVAEADTRERLSGWTALLETPQIFVERIDEALEGEAWAWLRRSR